jgi:hypothetical protein
VTDRLEEGCPENSICKPVASFRKNLKDNLGAQQRVAFGGAVGVTADGSRPTRPGAVVTEEASAGYAPQPERELQEFIWMESWCFAALDAVVATPSLLSEQQHLPPRSSLAAGPRNFDSGDWVDERSQPSGSAGATSRQSAGRVPIHFCGLTQAYFSVLSRFHLPLFRP